MARRLCRELEPHLKPNDSFFRAPVDVKKQVAIDIYLLGSSAEYRSIENLFGVSTSTVCKVVHVVCEVIAENILEKYVSFPTGARTKLSFGFKCGSSSMQRYSKFSSHC